MEAAPISDAIFSICSYDRSVEIDDRDLTTTANDLLTDATALAQELHHALVEPAHVAFLLFSGSVLPGKGESYAHLGMRMMCRAGVSERGATFVKDELSLCESRPEEVAHVNFSRGFVDFMRDAQQEAQIFADRLIGVDHLAIAAAIHMAEFGSEVGFNYEDFRIAAEQVRGIYQAPAEYTPDESDEDAALGGKYGLQVAVDSFDDEHSVYTAELVELLQGKEDIAARLESRTSPASSAPDSPEAHADFGIDLGFK
jgi:hypothetical protein